VASAIVVVAAAVANQNDKVASRFIIDFSLSFCFVFSTVERHTTRERMSRVPKMRLAKNRRAR